jgi:NADH dehydrogenase
MIGRNSAIAKVGERRHELQGAIAFAAWLGVHAALLCSTRAKIEALWNGAGIISVGRVAIQFSTAPKTCKSTGTKLERNPLQRRPRAVTLIQHNK